MIYGKKLTWVSGGIRENVFVCASVWYRNNKVKVMYMASFSRKQCIMMISNPKPNNKKFHLPSQTTVTTQCGMCIVSLYLHIS